PGHRRGAVLRRPAVRRLDRAHRPARRGPPDDAAQPAREGAAAGRQHRGAAGSRGADLDRPGAYDEPVPARPDRRGHRRPRDARSVMADKISAPKGVPEYLPPDSATFLAVHEALAAPAIAAGYGYIELPVFEDTSLYVRGVGESTDVVSKEMY